MTIEEIKQVLGKKATTFVAGGFRPTFQVEESWIGKVEWFLKEEEIPTDDDGLTMLPLMQLYLENLPFVPEALEGIKLLTVFVSQNIPSDILPSGSYWTVREYHTLDCLERKKLTHSSSFLTPFPLKPSFIEEDFPIWDDEYSFSKTVENEILRLEKEGSIESYYATFDQNYEHKLGGYPTYCQSGISFGEGFEFVLQITSDSKVGFSIGDSGILFLAKNKETREWLLYWDCY